MLRPRPEMGKWNWFWTESFSTIPIKKIFIFLEKWINRDLLSWDFNQFNPVLKEYSRATTPRDYFRFLFAKICVMIWICQCVLHILEPSDYNPRYKSGFEGFLWLLESPNDSIMTMIVYICNSVAW